MPSPVQWSQLPDLADVPPIDETDVACFKALRDGLKAHGKAERFGVALLDSHFDLDEDEIMLEFPDSGSRTLQSRLAKPAGVGVGSVPTLGVLDGEVVGDADYYCHSYCWETLLGQSLRHQQRNGDRRGR